LYKIEKETKEVFKNDKSKWCSDSVQPVPT